MLTERDKQIYKFLHRYFYARAHQVRDAVIPSDTDGSITRGRLRAAEKAGDARRYLPKHIDPNNPQTTAPIWILTQQGCATLAKALGDTTFLRAAEPSFAAWMSLSHYCCTTSIMWTIDRAVAAQDRVKLSDMAFEHEVADPRADDPARRYRLYTRISDSPKVVCVPDAGFVLEVDGRQRAFFLEYETGSDNPSRVCALKHKGYAGLHATKKYLDIYPGVQDFRVLVLCPYVSWRDALRKELKGKPGQALWLLVATPEFSAQTCLHAPIVYKTDCEDPRLLVPAAPSAAVTAGGGPGERVGGGAGKAVTA